MSGYTEFTLNDSVMVRLTDHGRRIDRQSYDSLNEHYNGKLPFPYRPVTEDAEGWSKWQLWHLFEEFGPHIGMGRGNPFDLTIRLLTERQSEPDQPITIPAP